MCVNRNKKNVRQIEFPWLAMLVLMFCCLFHELFQFLSPILVCSRNAWHSVDVQNDNEHDPMAFQKYLKSKLSNCIKKYLIRAIDILYFNSSSLSRIIQIFVII